MPNDKTPRCVLTTVSDIYDEKINITDQELRTAVLLLTTTLFSTVDPHGTEGPKCMQKIAPSLTKPYTEMPTDLTPGTIQFKERVSMARASIKALCGVAQSAMHARHRPHNPSNN